MPNTFIDNRDRWLQMSEIDYLGQFLKAWLAFNAWYRSAYNESQDRKIIEEIKWNANPIASKFRPLLRNSSEEAVQFRAEIGLLHHRLEDYELHNGKGGNKIRIRFKQVDIREEPPLRKIENHYGYEIVADRIAGGTVTVTVKKIVTGRLLVNLNQTKFDLTLLENDTNFKNLPTEQLKIKCRRIYQSVSPRLPKDLTMGDMEEILCGTHSFKCGEDFLFAGVLEIIYLMRCTLFHGELVPTRESAECYEPCYRIIRRFLASIE